MDSADTPAHLFTGFTLIPQAGAGQFSFGGRALESEPQFIPLVPLPGYLWTLRETFRQWSGIASSSDGNRLAAITADGQIYISEDAGLTWNARESRRGWRAITSSSDGMKLAAVTQPGFSGKIHTSDNGGFTWTARESDRNWVSIASSEDGSRLIAAEQESLGFGIPGHLYVSSDSGASWTQREMSRAWSDVASSADGSAMVAVTKGGLIYRSGDFGITWTEHASPLDWRAVASSESGETLLAAAVSGLFLSTDSGATWNQQIAGRAGWVDVVCSKDGKHLIACSSSDSFFSDDGGKSWKKRAYLSGTNSSLTASADGLKVAAISGGRIHTSVAALPPLVFTPALNASGDAHAGFKFQVEDSGAAGSNTDPVPRNLTINVSAVNDPPTVANPLYDYTIGDNRTTPYEFPANSFTDLEEGTVLTLTASLADNTPLPSWLVFDASAPAFLATTTTAHIGLTLEVRVTATDHGDPPESVRDNFLLKVINQDDIPAGTNRSGTLNRSGSYQFSTGDFGFSDPKDIPPNNFMRVKLATLPARGGLTIDGVPAQVGAYAFVQPSPAGNYWTPRTTVNRNWAALASSADGSKLLGAVTSGQLYTSIDAGATWTPRESNRAWSAVASSADGTKLAAAYSSYILTSTDSGITWTTSLSAENGWITITSSVDGTRLAALGRFGELKTSADSGVSWISRFPDNSGFLSGWWYDMASSADGQTLIALSMSRGLFISRDSGVSWRRANGFGTTVACSADGEKIVLAGSNSIQTSSDSGFAWKRQDLSGNWTDIASSSDGTRLAVISSITGGKLQISTDSGATWIPKENRRNWKAIASSSDGSRLVALPVTGTPYTSQPYPAQRLIYTPPAGASGAPYTSFTFQVEDDGSTTSPLDITPNTFTLDVLPQTAFQAWADLNGLPADPGANGGTHLLNFAFGLAADGSQTGSSLTISGNVITGRGTPALHPVTSSDGAGFAALFARRKNSGIAYTIQFTSDFMAWENGAAGMGGGQITQV